MTNIDKLHYVNTTIDSIYSEILATSDITKLEYLDDLLNDVIIERDKLNELVEDEINQIFG